MQLLGIVQRPKSTVGRYARYSPARISAYLHIDVEPILFTHFRVLIPSAHTPLFDTPSSVCSTLRDFVLLAGRLDTTVKLIAAITRCRAYDPGGRVDYRSHIFENAKTDPGLRFHTSAGARVCEPVPNYRPRDTVNLGNGVLISYEVRAQSDAAAHPTKVHAEASHPPGSPTPLPVKSLSECETFVISLVDRLCRASGLEQIAWTAERMRTPFLELGGLDSLEVENLGHLLNEELPFELPSTTLFDYATPAQLAAHIHALHTENRPKQQTEELSQSARREQFCPGSNL